MTPRLTLVIAFLLPWVGFVYWTARKFWRPPTNPELARFFYWTRVLGIPMTAIATIVITEAMPLAVFTYWQEMMYWAVITFPVMTWATYFALRTFRAVMIHVYRM